MKKIQNKQKKIKDIEEIAEMAEKGEDISKHFTGEHVAKQRVNIDFPLALLKLIDDECKRIGVTRQSWIKIACDEQIRKIKNNSLAA